MLIELTNQAAAGLLRELELLQLIRVIPNPVSMPKKIPLKKYRGIISKQDGKQLQEHVNQMRSQWSNI